MSLREPVQTLQLEAVLLIYHTKQYIKFPYHSPWYICLIEEVRAASKSPHLKFGYFLSMSQHAVSADTIPNSAVGIFSLKTERTKT